MNIYCVCRSWYEQGIVFDSEFHTAVLGVYLFRKVADKVCSRLTKFSPTCEYHVEKHHISLLSNLIKIVK